MSTIEDDDYERRKQQRLRALRKPNPRCGTCPEDRWQTLELHHIAGKDHDDTLGILCRNCHRIASDAQRDHPPAQVSIDSYLEAIGRFLLGLADLLGMAVERLVEFGTHLIEQARLHPVEGGVQ